jgi:hypothetical protein
VTFLQIEVVRDNAIANKTCFCLGDNRSNMFNLKGWGACIPNGKNQSKLAASSFLSAKSHKSKAFARNFSQSCQKIANAQDRDM